MIAEFLGLRSRPERRATIENPRYSLNDPATWDGLFSGQQTEAGLPINHEKALRYSPVFQGVSKISGDIAKLPLDGYKRRDDGGREPAVRHPSYRIVRRRANRETSAIVFWRRLIGHACLYGNGYAFILRNGNGQPAEMINLLPDRTAPKRVKIPGQPDGQLIYETEASGEARPRVLFPDEVFHLEGLGVDGLAGLDLVEQARNSIALGLAAEKFASKFFKNGARVSGVLELPLGTTPKSAEKLEEGWLKRNGNLDQAFTTAILRDGAKFHSTSIAPNEGQMTESRREQVREVARWLNMDPSRLGEESGVSYASKEEDNRNYLDSTLQIWLELICAECFLKLLTPAEQLAETHYFEHNLNSLLRTEPYKRYQVYAIGVKNRILTPNECRLKENMNPIDGGDEFPELKPGPGKPPPNEGTKPALEEESAKTPATREEVLPDPRITRVIHGIGHRARRKAATPAAFLDWLDGDLESHRAEFRELLGEVDQEATFAPIIEALKRIAETASAEQLPGAVDECMSQFEQQTIQRKAA